MALNPLSLLPSYSRIPSGFGFGWSRFWDLYVSTYGYYESTTSTKMLSLSNGDKIKAQVRLIEKFDATVTAGESCRLMIRKI